MHNRGRAAESRRRPAAARRTTAGSAGAARWVGCAATPHDTLSAILLAQCPAWPAFASAETRAAILQCLDAEHTPEGLPANAPPLTRELLAALARADAEAARATASTPEADRETPGDAA